MGVPLGSRPRSSVVVSGTGKRAVQIFMSYRRAGDLFFSGRVIDSLRNAFGDESVFLDVDSIPFGTDFREVIRDRIESSDAVVAIIGPEWEGAFKQYEGGDDYVRLELEEALRQKRPILPVLVSQTRMPSSTALPEMIKPIAYLNALQIRPDPDFRPDAARLVQALGRTKALNDERRDAERRRLDAEEQERIALEDLARQSQLSEDAELARLRAEREAADRAREAAEAETAAATVRYEALLTQQREHADKAASDLGRRAAEEAASRAAEASEANDALRSANEHALSLKREHEEASSALAEARREVTRLRAAEAIASTPTQVLPATPAPLRVESTRPADVAGATLPRPAGSPAHGPPLSPTPMPAPTPSVDRGPGRRLRTMMLAVAGTVVALVVVVVAVSHRGSKDLARAGASVTSTSAAPASSSTAVPTSATTSTSATASMSATAATPGVLAPALQPWPVSCTTSTVLTQDGAGALANEAVELRVMSAGAATESASGVVKAGSDGSFLISFACDPADPTASWVVTFVGLNSDRRGSVTVEKTAGSPETTTIASTRVRPSTASPVSAAATAPPPQTSPPTAPPSVNTTVAQTTNTTLRPRP